MIFFFQAEDGIRDVAVTGVQTCALPISFAHIIARPCHQGAIGISNLLVRLFMDVAFSGCRIENNQVLLKSFGLRGHLALRRQGDARAVENQAVVASHLIHVNDWPFVCQRDGAQHLETQRTLVERVRRTREVQQHRTSLPDNLADRIALVQLLGPKIRSEEHTSELQSRLHLVCRLLLEKKKKTTTTHSYTRTCPSVDL